MDTAEPPRVVFESATECADRDRAEDQIRQALAHAHGTGWAVTIRIRPAVLPAVSAEGEVSDETGARRAREVTEGTVADCAGLATAMGAWASQVLASQAPGTPSGEPSVSGQTGTEPLQALPPPQPPPAIAAPAQSGPPPAPIPPVAPRAGSDRAPESAVPAAAAPPRDESAPLELGVGTFLMAGGGAGGYAGVAPFLIDDVGQAVFLRPSVALGGSIATNVPSTWAAARLDTCMRLPGRYATRGGLQLDLCGGADVGFSYLSSGTVAGTPPTGQTLPYVDLGPSLDLRAEVGRLAVTLRGVVGIDVAREGFVDATGTRVDVPLWSWRLELDVSLVLRGERTDAQVAQQTAD